MKFFQKRGVAVVLMLLAIAASIAWGQYKKPVAEVLSGGAPLDESLPTGAFTPYIVDGANVLSGKTESAIALYDANWDQMAGSILAVVTVKSAGNVEDAAYDWAYDLELGEDDGILLISADTKAYRLVTTSGEFYDILDALPNSYVDSAMYEAVQKGDYNGAVLNLMNGLHIQFSQRAASLKDSTGNILFAFLRVLLLAFIVWLIFDCIRYNRYRRRYLASGGTPAARYSPIFWGRSLYRPRPPVHRDHYSPPHPPVGGSFSPPRGGSRPPSSSRPSSPSRSGSFGGGRGGGFRGRR